MKGTLCFLLVMTTPLSSASRPETHTYHWPLDAEPAMSSTFCEYRPGHFHSGIDLKTWGRVGLRVFALDAGHVWRVKVSPWGSGRSVYVKLADGRSAVYFHLSEFAPPIRRLVEQEQERLQRYSIDLFLEPEDVPVIPGQVVGYSGDSGTGGPHLHFELRDTSNRPMNPLTHGLSVADTVAPTATAVSITPLDATSTVDGGHRPVVIPLRTSGAGRFKADKAATVSGVVGIGAHMYDRANGASNKLAVYRTELYVDGRLLYRSQYDFFSFGQTRHVYLDRDFSLMRSGEGRFQRLYRVAGNELPFYSGPAAQEIGSAGGGWSPVSFAWTSVPGWHRVRIVGADANGNEGETELDVLVDSRPFVVTFEGRRQGDRFSVEATAGDADDGVRFVRFECSTDFGESWVAEAVDSTNSPPGLYEAEFALNGSGPVLCRARACDGFGEWSSPKICLVSEEQHGAETGELTFRCEPRFFDTFVEWIVTANRPLARTPQVTVAQRGGLPIDVSVTRLDLRSFSSIYAFTPDLDGPTLLSIVGRDVGGSVGRYESFFDAYPVTKKRGGNIFSPDGMALARFEPGGAYWDLWARIEIDTLRESPFLPLQSDLYHFGPADVPFDEGAEIGLRWCGNGTFSERIGVYRYLGEDVWTYEGADIDSAGETVWTSVSSFGFFALMEDTIFPSVWNLTPKEGSRISPKDVVLFARVKDRGSGIGREEDLVMELDGRRVISEYDPEGEWLTHRVKEPLPLGSHHLSVSATDQAGNTTRRDSRFRVVQ